MMRGAPEWECTKTCLVLLALACGLPGSAASSEVGEPTALEVLPASVTLRGPFAFRQLIVSGRYANGAVRDLTSFCTIAVEPADIVAIDAGALVVPRRDGAAVLIVKAEGLSAKVPVIVEEFRATAPFSFRDYLEPVLTVGGCNAGICHGSPTGKNGFHLSLRGFDPESDYRELTRAVWGRRINRERPDASLIYQKATGGLVHEGGPRFAKQSLPAQWLRAWLAAGMADDRPNRPGLQGLEVLPGSRTLAAPARRQQLAVLGHFADGSVRDVTHLCLFTNSGPLVADVGASGLVEFTRGGEVAILCRYQDRFASVRLTFLEPRPGFRWSNPPEFNYVDRHVDSKLKTLNLNPVAACGDEEFIRRATLDLCGVLPTPTEIKSFLAGKEPNKREALVDALLDRPEYADFWALKWADVLRLRSSIHRVKGVNVYHQWLRQQIAANTPFDQVARALLTGNGDTFVNPAANYYRIGLDLNRPGAEEVRAQLTEMTAQVFCGVRIQCAKCHNHPLERWTQDDYYGLAASFARVGRKRAPDQPFTDPALRIRAPGAEVIYPARAGEVLHPRTGLVVPPRFFGELAPVPSGKDRRELLADWLTGPKNRFFARSVVNRVWFHLLGRGIVDPVDDFRDSNPPANDELLDALAGDFVVRNFNVKHIVRLICTSRTYGLSARGDESNPDEVRYFARATARQYSAEQLIDAVCAATEAPEKYPGLPSGTRAVQIADGDISHPFMKTFHKPPRELACECERESDGSLAQALQFVNGKLIKQKLAQPDNRIGRLLAGRATDRNILEELYLATVSRFPTDEERRVMLAYLASKDNRRGAWEDVQWALLNSSEFRFRH
jgi:hypothetical protein